MTKAVLVVVPIALLMAGIQVALILGLRSLVSPQRQQPVQWPLTLMAALSATLLAAGVGRHYWDIWRHRTVRGISFIFVAIDAAGDLFSLASVCFQPRLDPLGLVIYTTEFVLWCGIFACGGYYNLLPMVRSRWSSSSAARRARLEMEASLPRHTEPGSFADQGAGTGAVTLHDMPSSTSVFRTANNEDSTIRVRNIGSRGGRGTEQGGSSGQAVADHP